MKVERSTPKGAVFLSYASQDAEAARRLCDALRAAGVEVWFDADGGLEHGDEWDAKIRRQIKECALFLAVISANTQAREEGYFRIEWDLAAERARGIASGVAFILPVVIDGTREPDALVPDRFRSVQWTKLPGGNIPPEVLQRFLKLWSHRAGVLKHQRGESPAAGIADPGGSSDRARPGSATPRTGQPRSVWPWVALGVVALVAAYLVFKPRRSPEHIARLAADVPQPAAAVQAPKVAPVAEYPRDPELRRARQLLYTMDAIPEDFRLAEDILKPVLARQPNDPDTVTTAAEVALEFGIRGFDLTGARRTQTQRLTERAVQLAPDNPYALAALARHLLFTNAQLGRAEELIRHAITLHPDEARFHRTFYSILSVTKPAEADAQAARMAAQFPRDPLVLYDIARRYKDDNDLVQAEQWFDRTLALPTPPAFALIWKAWLMAWVHGDLAGMKQWLDRVPDRQRANARVANARYVHGLLTGDTDHALQALGEVAEDWLTDFDFTGPKTLLVAFLRQRTGQTDLARVQFEAALTATNAEVDKNPTDLRPQRAKLWALIGLGRLEEARALQRVLLQAAPRPYVLSFRSLGWTNTVTSCLLLGLRAEAVDLLRETCTDANSRLVLRNLFQLDPRLAPWRDDREIAALLAPPAPGPSAPVADLSAAALAKVDDKSVAVLAFANLSDDKGNEYFSDGISEELLNVLAKIPGLKVSARTSAFYFKGKEVPIPEIAKQLGVAYVVEGSVRKQGEKVRITAQLIKAEGGFHVWSDTFTRDLKDVFAVQDEIAGLIAKNLELKMGMTAGPVREINPEAYQEYLIGRALVAKAGMADIKEAVMHFERAAAVEPKFTAAWVQLASAHTQLGRWGGAATLQAWPAARTAIDRALTLEPDSPDVLLALGWIQRTSDWNWRGAEQTYRRALALRPNHPDTLSAAAVLLFNIGRKEEALRLGRQAVQLDPLNAATQLDLSLIFYFSEEWAEQEKLARRAIQLAPAGVSYQVMLAYSLAGQRRFAEAEAVARLETDDVGRLSALGMFAVLQGQPEAARGYRRQLEALYLVRGDTADLQLGIADISAGLGEKDRAFAALEIIRSARDSSVAWLRNDSYLRPLYSDPRWPVFLRKVGLADDQLQ